MENKKEKLLLNARTAGFSFSVMAVVYVLLSFFGRLILDVIFPDGGAGVIAVGSLFSVFSMMGILVFLVSRNGAGVIKDLGVKKTSLYYYALAILLSVGMFFGLGFVNDSIVRLFFSLGVYVPQTEIPLENVGHYLLFVMVLAIFPAIAEELFFRGLLLRSLNGIKTVYAVVISSVCFAIYHSSVAQFAYQMLYGVAFAILAILAKSVIPCIIAHFLNNFAILTLEYFKVNVDLYSPAIIVIGTIALLVFIVTCVRRLKKKENNGQEEYKKLQEFFMPYGVFGLAIFLLLLIGNLMAV